MKAGREPAACHSVSVVIPALNEESTLPGLLSFLLHQCDPQPAEIIVADNGSHDRTVGTVRSGFPQVRVVEDSSEFKTRASAQNCGLAAARGDCVMFLHADTRPPTDFVTHVREVLNDPTVSHGAFYLTIQGQRFVSWHHWLKTYYGFLTHPINAIFKGYRIFFGDQAIFCRRSQLDQVQGFDLIPILEDQELNKKMMRFGRARLANAVCTTSGRRIQLYGVFLITLLHLFIGVGGELGIPLAWLKPLYPPQHELEEAERLRALKSALTGMRTHEETFLWDEIMVKNSYSHPRIKLPNGGTVIDVGSNCGVFSLWADHRMRNGTIHAVEPNSVLLPALAANLKLCTHNKVKVHDVGFSSCSSLGRDFKVFSNTPGWSGFNQSITQLSRDSLRFVQNWFASYVGTLVAFALNPAVYMIHWCCFLWLSKHQTVSIPTMRLSDWMRNECIGSVDLLKIDVEKHELEVLKGIDPAEWRRIDAVVVEVEVQHQEIRELLTDQGFKVETHVDPYFRGTSYMMMWGFRNEPRGH